MPAAPARPDRRRLSNFGVQPRDGTLPDWGPPVTLNALVIGANNAAGRDSGGPDIAEPTAWFSSDLFPGSGAVVGAAPGFEDFAAATARNLVRDPSGIAVSALVS